jgi:hypothetical protein
MDEIGEVTRGSGREGTPDSWDGGRDLVGEEEGGREEVEDERNGGTVKEPGETDGVACQGECESKTGARRGRQGCARGSAVSCWHYS